MPRHGVGLANAVPTRSPSPTLDLSKSVELYVCTPLHICLYMSVPRPITAGRGGGGLCCRMQTLRVLPGLSAGCLLPRPHPQIPKAAARTTSPDWRWAGLWRCSRCSRAARATCCLTRRRGALLPDTGERGSHGPPPHRKTSALMCQPLHRLTSSRSSSGRRRAHRASRSG